MMVSAHCCARRCCRQDFKKRAWWFWKRQGLMWRVWLFQACSTTSTVWCKCVWMCWLIGAWKKNKTKQNCRFAVFMDGIKLWLTILCHMAWPQDPCRRTLQVPQASSKPDPTYSSEGNSCTLKWISCCYSSFFFCAPKTAFVIIYKTGAIQKKGS